MSKCRHRRAERGAVVVEIALSIPAILFVLAASLYMATYARNRVSVEEDLQRAVKLCSRGLPAASMDACVQNALEGRLAFCTDPTIRTEFRTFDRTYDRADDERLPEPITKTLGLLRGEVSCSMDIEVWQYLSRTVEFTTQAAMPVRLDTETRP